MNRKALALGAVLGFLVAVVPSCGGTKCSPASCTGCCDAKGACVKDPDNKKAATCGKNGASCQDCGAGTCDAAQVCMGGTGGGMGGGTGGGTGGGMVTACNSTNCSGCCPAGGGSCIPYASQNANTCGGGAAACGACTTGQQCSYTAQGCVTSMVADAGPEGGKTGAPCATDTDCGFGTAGNTLKCRLATALGDGGYPGGYCTKVCDMPGQCAGDTTCVGIPERFGEVDSLCLPKCDPANGDDDCRMPDYGCYTIGEGEGICWLSNPPMIAVDAGPIPGTVGNACMTATDCQSPPSVGVYCIGFPDGGVQDGYNAGYCARDCSTPEQGCSTDGGAICFNFGNDMDPFLECAKVCNVATDGGGQGDCRTDYVCAGLTFADGGAAPQGICIPNCHNMGAGWTCPMGAGTCQANGLCQ